MKQLFNVKGTLKSWEILKQEYNLKENRKFKWMQLICAIPVAGKDCLAYDKGNSFNLAIQDHYLIKQNQISPLELVFWLSNSMN